jgi:hypothetical protein
MKRFGVDGVKTGPDFRADSFLAGLIEEGECGVAGKEERADTLPAWFHVGDKIRA